LKIRSFLGRLFANWPAKILSITIAVLLFVFNRMNNLTENSLEVPLTVILPKGYAIAAPYQEKVRFTIKGDDQESISQIAPDNFWAYIDLSEYSKEGDIKVPVRYTRKGPALSSNVFVDKVEPAYIQVGLEREMIRAVSVKPDLKGKLKDGYSLEKYALIPAVIQVKGPRSRVESLDRVITEGIDLTNRSSDFTLKVNILLLDPFLSFAEEKNIEFQAEIREIVEIKQFIQLPIKTLNINPALAWENDDLNGQITLRGPKIFMDALKTEDIELTVDCGGLRDAGEYRLRVSPSVPPGLEIRNFEPEQAQIILKKAEKKKE